MTNQQSLIKVRVAFGDDPYDAQQSVDNGMIIDISDCKPTTWTLVVPVDAKAICIRSFPEQDQDNKYD